MSEFTVPFVPPDVSQEEFYDVAIRPAVVDFLSRANCDCGLLAYGATGSGKTYSTQVCLPTSPTVLLFSNLN